MSDATHTLFRPIAIVLAVMLVGLYALLTWYEGTLRDQLAARAIEITQVNQRLSATEAALLEKRAANARLDGEIADLKARHAEEHEAIEAELAAAETRNEELNGEMAALRESHVQSLAAERRKAEEEYAELEQRHTAAQEQIAALEQRIVGEAEAHEDALRIVRADLSEQVVFLRTALQGSAPEQAAQLEDLQQDVQTHRLAMERAQREVDDLEQMRADLGARLAQLEAEHSAAITDAHARISVLEETLRDERAALAELRDEHDSIVSELQGALVAARTAVEDREASLRVAEQVQADYQEKVAEAAVRIGGLEGMLDDVQRNALQYRRETSEQFARVRDLYERIAALGGEKTEHGMLLALPEEALRFRVGAAELPAQDIPSFDQVASLLVDHPELVARIEGHTDSSGREETNLVLSEARAQAVRQALIDRGVAPERLLAAGVGDTRPVATNATVVGRRLNRRVEIYVIETDRP